MSEPTVRQMLIGKRILEVYASTPSEARILVRLEDRTHIIVFNGVVNDYEENVCVSIMNGAETCFLNRGKLFGDLSVAEESEDDHAR